MKEIKDLGLIQESRISTNSANTKELYIVVTEDPSMKMKFRTYIAQRADEKPATINIAGYEVATINSEINAQLKDTIIYKDAVELVKKCGSELEILTIPWHRIIRIKTLKFSIK